MLQADLYHLAHSVVREFMHSDDEDEKKQHHAIYNANKIMVDRFLSDCDDFKQGNKVDWSDLP